MPFEAPLADKIRALAESLKTRRPAPAGVPDPRRAVPERSMAPAPPRPPGVPDQGGTRVDPWPQALPGLGPRTNGPFVPCDRCGSGTWVRYGGTELCLLCARRHAADESPDRRPVPLDSTDPAPQPGATTADLIGRYELVLAKLWLLNVVDGAVWSSQAHQADVEDARQLLAEQATLCDELGPEFAAAVSRRHARTWARVMNRCPWCGKAGIFHTTESGEANVDDQISDLVDPPDEASS
jgi:hypothetical protein